ncbi:MAG: hypothetical protein GXX78_08755 [Bacteroidales bacterium]|nr:hypothetical protein [Bacteroidales bacterium]
MKRLLFCILLFCLSIEVEAQGWLTEENNIEINWNFTIQGGASLLLGELKRDFSGSENAMKNLPDFGLNIMLGKMVWERIDLGFEAGFSNCRGSNGYPSTIHYLTHSVRFNNTQSMFLPYPVMYQTSLYSAGPFIKYNFINFSSYRRSFIKLNLFARLGLGASYLESEMGYKEKVNYVLSGLSEPFFSSEEELSLMKRISVSITPSVGLNYQLNERIFFSVELGFLFNSSGLIDGVYNTKSTASPEVPNPIPVANNIPVFSFAARVMLGCTYFFNFDTHRKDMKNAWPFYYNRYRSYFSKYHTPASKRIIRERLPFYNPRLDN